MELLALIREHGLWAVFLASLLEQFGLPIPALPMLLIAGAVAAFDPWFGVLAVGVAALASLFGGGVLFLAGRAQGDRLLGLFCRISLSPHSCITHGLAAFRRFGPLALVFARFMPGLSAMAPPLAGSTGMAMGVFLVWQGVAGLLFAGASIGAGALCNATITQWLGTAAQFAKPAAGVTVALLALWLLYVAVLKRSR